MANEQADDAVKTTGTDERDPDTFDEEGPVEPFAMPLAEPLIVDGYRAFDRPSALFDALVEGDVFSFVRLPSSFDCCVQLPTSYWRTVDPGVFGAAFGAPPYQPQNTYRVPSGEVLQRVRHALEQRHFGTWNGEQNDQDLLYAIGNDQELGSYDDETPPPVDYLCGRLERDLARNPEAFVRPLGYAAFVLRKDLEAYREKRSVRSEANGRSNKLDWGEIWAAGIAYLIDNGVPRQTILHEIRIRMGRAASAGIPTEKTLQKQLSSKPIQKYLNSNLGR